MKQFITASIILFHFCSFGQYVDPANVKPFDSTIIWITAPSRDFFNADSIRKVNPRAYNNLMKLVGRDTIPICQHIYTTVHEKEVKVKQWRSNTMLPMIIPDTIITGKHEGQQLVCVKCFHLTKQILDYGNANNENKTGALTSMWPDLRRITDSLLKLNPPNTGLVDDRTHKLIMK